MANMANKKLLDPEYDPITVFSFSGSIIIPTEQGSYWASAVGGVVESRPTGNPFVLFSLKYIWGLSGDVSEFPESIKIRLNTAMAVTEKFDFKFPEPEVQAEEPVSTPLVEDETDENDETDEDDEDADDDWVEDDEETESNLAETSHSDDEISW
jgi:hypothetical protein